MGKGTEREEGDSREGRVEDGTERNLPTADAKKKSTLEPNIQ